MILNETACAVEDYVDRTDEAEKRLRSAAGKMAVFAIENLTGKHKDLALNAASAIADFLNIMGADDERADTPLELSR